MWLAPVIRPLEVLDSTFISLIRIAAMAMAPLRLSPHPLHLLQGILSSTSAASLYAGMAPDSQVGTVKLQGLTR